MSGFGRFQFTLWERTDETDTFAQIAGDYFARSLENATTAKRRASMDLLQKSPSHVARMRHNTKIQAGRRLIDVKSSREYRIVAVVKAERPRPGELVVDLYEEEPR